MLRQAEAEEAEEEAEDLAPRQLEAEEAEVRAEVEAAAELSQITKVSVSQAAEAEAQAAWEDRTEAEAEAAEAAAVVVRIKQTEEMAVQQEIPEIPVHNSVTIAQEAAAGLPAETEAVLAPVAKRMPMDIRAHQEIRLPTILL